MENVFGEDLVRKIPSSLEGIRWIGKDYIELLMTYIKELEYVVTHNCKVLHSESSGL